MESNEANGWSRLGTGLRRGLALSAAAAVLALSAGAVADDQGDPPWHRGQGSGPWMMGPGMMGQGGSGPGMMQGWGPGMMGPGMMHGWGPGMMGPGMMQGWGPGMMGPGMMHGGGPGMMGGRGWGSGDFLGLSDEQQEKAGQIHERLHGQHRELFGQMQDAAQTMRDLFAASSLDREAIVASRKSLSEVRQKMFEATLDARIEFDKLLTEEQRERMRRGSWRPGWYGGRGDR